MRLRDDVWNVNLWKLKLTLADRGRLERLHQQQDFLRLSDEDIAWIADLVRKYKGPQYLFGILARFWEIRSSDTHDPWKLTRAGSCWRNANCPDFAIECLDGVKGSSDMRLVGAFHTIRAGALRDKGELLLAVEEAKNAIALDADAPHPFNVLGAIAYQRLEFAEGDSYFEEAERRGSIGLERQEIEKALLSMSPTDKQKLAEYLLSKNPQKYAWVRKV
jgi:hypothetical protein